MVPYRIFRQLPELCPIRIWCNSHGSCAIYCQRGVDLFLVYLDFTYVWIPSWKRSRNDEKRRWRTDLTLHRSGKSWSIQVPDEHMAINWSSWFFPALKWGADQHLLVQQQGDHCARLFKETMLPIWWNLTQKQQKPVEMSRGNNLESTTQWRRWQTRPKEIQYIF